MKNLFQKEVKRLIVFGDIHGDKETLDFLKEYFSTKDDPDSLYVFLGDYADRGEYGVEVIDFVDNLINEKDNVIALMGNHENYKEGSSPTFRPWTLYEEVERKLEVLGVDD